MKLYYYQYKFQIKKKKKKKKKKKNGPDIQYLEDYITFDNFQKIWKKKSNQSLVYYIYINIIYIWSKTKLVIKYCVV